MSALLKQAFIGSADGGDEKPTAMTDGLCFLIPSSDRGRIEDHIASAIVESQKLLKRRMTTGQMHNPNVRFIVFSDVTAPLEITINSADTIEAGMAKLASARRRAENDGVIMSVPSP